MQTHTKILLVLGATLALANVLVGVFYNWWIMVTIELYAGVVLLLVLVGLHVFCLSGIGSE